MIRRHRHTTLITLATVVTLGASACSSDESARPDDTSDSTATTTEAPNAATTTSPAPTTDAPAGTEPSTTVAGPSAAPPTTVAPILDAAIRPAGFPGPIAAGTYRAMLVDPPIDLTFGEGWSAGWEPDDLTLAPNYTAGFVHPLTEGYVRLALWSMHGDSRIDDEETEDVRAFLRERPDVVDVTEADLTLPSGWTATQFEFAIDGDPDTWIPLQVNGVPIDDRGVTVGSGRPQHWTVIDTTLNYGGFTQPHVQLLATWEVLGIDHADANAVDSASAEAAALVAPVLSSITPAPVPAEGASLRVDWMSGGRDVEPTTVIQFDGTDVWGATATDESVIASVDDGVYVIDPSDDTFEESSVRYTGAGFGLGAGEGGLWMPDFDGTTVHSLDPDTLDEIAEIGVGVNPTSVSVGGGYAWSADHRGGTVTKIDPVTNESIARFTVSGPGRGGPYSPTAHGDDLWVPVPQFDQLTRIDATTGQIRANLTLPAPGNDPVVIGDRLFAYSTSNDMVHVVDTNTNQLVTSVLLGSFPLDIVDIDGTPWTLTVLDSEAWMVAIDPVSLEIVDQIRVNPSGRGILDAFGSIWISARDGSLTRYPRDEFVR
jgi:glutamine cyclotransferase